MSTATVTTNPSAAESVEATFDHSRIDTAQNDLRNAARILRTAANELAEAYGEHDAAITELPRNEADERFLLLNALGDSLATAGALVKDQQEVVTKRILKDYKHGDNFTIGEQTFHRYDEEKANSVSWKDVAAKAKSYLSGAQLGAITKLEAAYKAKKSTYYRLKAGPFKGKK